MSYQELGRGKYLSTRPQCLAPGNLRNACRCGHDPHACLRGECVHQHLEIVFEKDLPKAEIVA